MSSEKYSMFSLFLIVYTVNVNKVRFWRIERKGERI